MGNSSTELTVIPLFDKRKIFGNQITPVIVNLDTGSSVLEIKDVSSAARTLAIVGCQYVAAAAHTLTFYSDSTEIATYDLAANDGIMFAVGDSLSAMLIAKKGEALKVASSADIGKIMLYLVEFE